VLGAARIPAVASRVPSLDVWNGPLGIALLLVALGLAAAALSGTDRPAGFFRMTRGARGGTLFLAGAALLLSVGLRYASSLRVSGDEPHYLLMAQSLWREGDLDLQDNFAREDWREYTPGPVAPHYGTPRADGRPFPAHSVGLAFLLAPVYAAGGRLACVAVLALAAAGAAALCFVLALRVAASPPAALLGWLVALGPPLFFFGFHVYTEGPSAIALLGSLLLILGGPGAAGAASAALLAATLPWLHLKMIPSVLALALVAAVRLRGRPLVVFFGVAALLGIGFLAYYHRIFGVASPLAIYGGLPPTGERGSPLHAVLGLFLDRSFGLLPHAPVFLVALAGLPWLRGRERWPLALVGLAVLLPVLGWRMWWAGQSPPARFLVPLVPVLAAALALRVAGSPRGLARWARPLALIGLALALFMAWNPGALLLVNRGDRPTRLWAALSGQTPVARYLPSLVTGSGEELRVAALWIGAAAIVLLLDVLSRRSDVVDRAFAGLGLPLVLLLSIGVLVDTWARVRPVGAPALDPMAAAAPERPG
jgi:hypothetical protein